MDHTLRPERRAVRKLAFFAFALAAFSCAAGLGFCLMKSPQSLSEAYLAAAVQSLESGAVDQAVAQATNAVYMNPMSVDGWKILSKMLQQKGDVSGAAKALEIADRLQHNSASPAHSYALPAEFKLSFLAMGESDGL